MKIKIELQLNECDAIYNTINEGCEEFGAERCEDIFAERSVECKGLTLNQKVNEIDIDVNSEFTIWVLKIASKLIKFCKPFIGLFSEFMDGIDDWSAPKEEATLPDEDNAEVATDSNISMSETFDV